ncbi:MAG: transglycosylase SLT domain-containing protein [Solirubrobacterales bacterium]|nr:transglycosylase SLT domain-containing protein [Solirubrobacterales bacterium]
MRAEPQTRATIARAVGGLLLIALAAGAVAAIVLALGLGGREPLDLKVERIAREANEKARPAADPFAWRDSRREQFEVRAALGSSHVIYALSPGGVVASAKRTAAFRPRIEAAAARHGVDADTLEAIVFLESAGRPDVIAGPTPESASGLSQILPSTATDLLGMQVDLPRSIELTKRLAKAKSRAEADRLRAERAAIDERFDPDQALDGAARYLQIAEQRFGVEDLAVVSYHMGIGNLETVLRDYANAPDDQPIAGLIAADGLSYAQVYFDSSPAEHRKAYEMLSGFDDDSSEYLWKIEASEQMLSLYRKDPGRLADTADLATSKATLEEVFHPESKTDVYDDPDEIEDGIDNGELVPLPADRKLGWIEDRDLGELADELDQSPQLYRAMRPEALATLSYMAALVRNLSGESKPLRVTSAVRDRTYQDLLVTENSQATEEYSLHTTGWSFDIRRDYASDRQAVAFQFVLDRLSSLALIDYAVEPGAIHVTVSGLGKQLLEGS